MWLASDWKDYECIDAANGEKLEKWGGFMLCRPDPQVIWDEKAQPQCIILDEPTAMLDPLGRREVMDTVVRLNREQGITIILITHYMDEVARADRVIVLENGETIMDGAPGKVFGNYTALEEIGLDIPQSAALCVELRKLGMNIPGNALNPSECADMILNYVKGSSND